MASSLDENRRGRMLLKDFLVDHHHHHELPSCSSTSNLKKKNNKKSWNQQPAVHKVPFVSRGRRSRSSRILLLSRYSIKAATVSISAASDMVINAAIKFFPHIPTIKTTTTPPPISNNYHPVVSVNNNNNDNNKVVKIKDILRWKSFRDINNADYQIQEEIIMPLPNQYNSSSTTASVALAPTTDSTSCSKRSSSWRPGNDDFTVSEDEDGVLEFSEHYLRECPADQGTTISKRELEFNEEDQHSPVSVLDSPFQEDEAFSSSSSFQRSLASIERRKCSLMQRIEEFESLGCKNLERSPDQLSADEGGHEKHITINADDGGDAAAVREKAAQLLSRVIKGAAENSGEHNNREHQVLFDYFVQELTTTGADGGSGKLAGDEEMLRFAKTWLSSTGCKEEGCNNGGYYYWEWEVMEKSLRDSWNFSSSRSKSSFEEEERELGCKLEKMVLNDLIDQILFDLLSIK